MEFIQNNSKELVSLFIPLLTWIINTKLKVLRGQVFHFAFAK